MTEPRQRVTDERLEKMVADHEKRSWPRNGVLTQSEWEENLSDFARAPDITDAAFSLTMPTAALLDLRDARQRLKEAREHISNLYHLGCIAEVGSQYASWMRVLTKVRSFLDGQHEDGNPKADEMGGAPDATMKAESASQRPLAEGMRPALHDAGEVRPPRLAGTEGADKDAVTGPPSDLVKRLRDARAERRNLDMMLEAADALEAQQEVVEAARRLTARIDRATGKGYCDLNDMVALCAAVDRLNSQEGRPK